MERAGETAVKNVKNEGNRADILNKNRDANNSDGTALLVFTYIFY